MGANFAAFYFVGRIFTVEVEAAGLAVDGDDEGDAAEFRSVYSPGSTSQAYSLGLAAAAAASAAFLAAILSASSFLMRSSYATFVSSSPVLLLTTLITIHRRL